MKIFKDPRDNEALLRGINNILKPEYKLSEEKHPAQLITSKQKNDIIHKINFGYNSIGWVDIGFVIKYSKCSEEIVKYILYEQGFKEHSIPGKYVKKDEE